MTDSPTVASWRDIATLVGDSNRELSAKIDTLSALLNKTILEWEHRLTEVEIHSGAHASQIADLHTSLTGLYNLVGTVHDQVKEDDAVSKAITAKQLNTRTTFFAIFSILGMIATDYVGHLLVH